MAAADDTIAAIATAVGGGVGIVRISGPRAEAIARAVCPALPRALPSHRLYLVEARDPDRDVALDQVLAVVMRAPHSFTGDEVAELQGHGGAASLQALLAATLAAGARLATPGEFTRRAFLAGKIDLTQAEAVAALIGARDARALRAAQALRQGALGQRVEDARRRLVGALAEIEGALDFPEETAAERTAHDGPALATLGRELVRLAAGYRRPLDAVPEVLLTGQVNAGKSSLLNALCGSERALVDESPGTTRDLVFAEIELGGATVRLCDTAGVRGDEGAPSALEVRGQRLADARRAHAALALVVYDGQRGWDRLDEQLHAAAVQAGIPTLRVENKCDLPRAAGQGGALVVSARTGEGLEALRAAVTRALALDAEPEVPVASQRQADALARAGAAVARAAAVLDEAAEVAAVELRRALHQLGLVTGETADDDVLDALFARFCIGK